MKYNWVQLNSTNSEQVIWCQIPIHEALIFKALSFHILTLQNIVFQPAQKYSVLMHNFDKNHVYQIDLLAKTFSK